MEHPMSIFVVDLKSRTLCLSVSTSDCLHDLQNSIQEVTGISFEDQYIAGRHVIEEQVPLVEQGFSANATLYLSARLRGGKGGFGSLLRGSGKTAMTENEDACRDLSGRRLRLVNADKKLKDWADADKQRKETKQAAKEERDRAKAEQRAEDVQTNLEAIRKDQNVVLSSVAKALESSRKAALKRPAVPGPKPAHKKTRYSSDSEGSESGADESDEEAQERPSSEASERAQEADEKLSSVKEIGEAKEVMIKQVTSVASENGTTTIAREISLAG